MLERHPSYLSSLQHARNDLRIVETSVHERLLHRRLLHEDPPLRERAQDVSVPVRASRSPLGATCMPTSPAIIIHSNISPFSILTSTSAYAGGSCGSSFHGFYLPYSLCLSLNANSNYGMNTSHGESLIMSCFTTVNRSGHYFCSRSSVISAHCCLVAPYFPTRG